MVYYTLVVYAFFSNICCTVLTTEIHWQLSYEGCKSTQKKIEEDWRKRYPDADSITSFCKKRINDHLNF